MSTLVDLTPPPVRLFQTGGGEYNWRKSGRCIVRDNSPQLSCGRLTTDDWEEGGRSCLDRLFLESSAGVALTLAPTIIDTGANQRKKKQYTLKNKPPISTGGVNGRGFGPKRT